MGREIQLGLIVLTLVIIVAEIVLIKKILYKRGQATLARLIGFFCLLAMISFLCVTIYSFPHYQSPLATPPVLETTILSLHIRIRPMILICLPIFFLLAMGAFWFTNRPKSADFLIETEGELKKVSWPQFKEWFNSTIAVLVVIVFTTVFLAAISFLVSSLLRKIGIGV